MSVYAMPGHMSLFPVLSFKKSAEFNFLYPLNLTLTWVVAECVKKTKTKTKQKEGRKGEEKCTSSAPPGAGAQTHGR